MTRKNCLCPGKDRRTISRNPSTEKQRAARVFDVPRDVKGLGAVVVHGGSGPTAFIIGDSQSLLHRPTVIKLDVLADVHSQ